MADTVDGDLELAFEDLVDFLLRMEVLMDRGIAVEFLVREGHRHRMKIASAPARQAFNDPQRIGIDDRQDSPPS
jgi:hypothetical protein